MADETLREVIEETRAGLDPRLEPLLDALAAGADSDVEAAWRTILEEAVHEA